jgi:hypothetical protein
MFYRLAGLALCWSSFLTAQPFRFTERPIRDLGRERITGCALEATNLVTWGDRLLRWDLPQPKPRVIQKKIGAAFLEGGCVMDVDNNGHLDIVVNEGGSQPVLVWFEAPRWIRHVIDSGVDAHDIARGIFQQHRGIVVVHRRNQVRYYEIPSDPTQRWSVRDLYSFYSPSDQGGLHLGDVDRDGRRDIVCGNYWIQQPEVFDLPWRLFAIKTWSEEKLSGVSRFAMSHLFGRDRPPNLIVSQGEMANARLAWYEKAPDPKQLWTEHRIEDDLRLNEPHSLAVADFDGDGRPDILVAERSGAGRLIIFRNERDEKLVPHVIGKGARLYSVIVFDLNNDGRPDILAVGRSSIAWWENQQSSGGRFTQGPRRSSRDN